MFDGRVPDFEIIGGGSVCLLVPLTREGRRWIEENIALDESVFLGRGLGVESRYLEAILDGITNDGLVIAGGVN